MGDLCIAISALRLICEIPISLLAWTEEVTHLL